MIMVHVENSVQRWKKDWTNLGEKVISEIHMQKHFYRYRPSILPENESDFKNVLQASSENMYCLEPNQNHCAMG